jgi:hypothetical protein
MNYVCILDFLRIRTRDPGWILFKMAAFNQKNQMSIANQHLKSNLYDILIKRAASEHENFASLLLEWVENWEWYMLEFIHSLAPIYDV